MDGPLRIILHFTFYLPTYLEHTYVHSQTYSQQSSGYRYHTPM